MTDKETIQTEKGYVKLYKNSRGYNWEIKCFVGDEQKEHEKLIKQVESLNVLMLNSFMEAD